MRTKTYEIFEINADVLALLTAIHEIGWEELRESSIHRLFYLSSVLFSFKEPEKSEYRNYHFSLSTTGPYSDMIERSIVDLKRRDILSSLEGDNLRVNLSIAKQEGLPLSDKITWFRIVAYIIALYGEDKIFGFVIQDPQYKYDFQTNSKTEIDTSSHNRTIQTLNQFKEAFEQTLEDVSQIDDREYLELYFEFVFSKIIKRD